MFQYQNRKMFQASSEQSLCMSAAGRKFKLGLVYDAYNHKLFESLDLLDKYPDAPKSRLCPSLSLCMNSSYTISERLQAFEFGGHLEARAAFGLGQLGSASARYIECNSSSTEQARMTLQYKQTKRYNELDTATVQKLSGNHDVLESARKRGATHFVAGISYGNQVLIDFKLAQSYEKKHDKLDIQLKGFISMFQALANKANKDKTRMDKTVNEIQFDCFCESMDIKPPESFEEAMNIYQRLPSTLQDIETVDSVYLLPLSLLDKDANEFKQSTINAKAMKELVNIRDTLHEQELQCKAMTNRGINASKTMDALKMYTEELKCKLLTTTVERWDGIVKQHNNSRFQTEAFQKSIKQEFKARVCHICTLLFTTEYDLDEHMKIHNACRSCNKTFPTPSGLAEHTRKKKAYKCDMCPENFSTESERTQHMKIHIAYKCAWCNKNSSTGSEHLQHVRIHLDRWCTYCHTEFDTESELAQHKKDIKNRVCQRCNNEFRTEHELTQHMKDFDGHECHICNRKCCTDELLASHMRSYHVHKCRICDKECSSESELEQHMKLHKHRTCDRCRKELSSESEVAQHKESVNTYFCCSCNDEFCTEHELAQHLKIKHGPHTAV